MSLRELSRQTFSSPDELNFDDLNTGCMLRIADSMETLAKSHVTLQSERDRYKQWWQNQLESNLCLRRQISGLRGYITRLKKRIK